MRKEELRLGNWVYSTNHKKTCRIIRIDCDYDLLNAEPIQLTEEILLKCGFEKTFPNGALWSYKGFNLYVRDEIFYIDIKLNYLHQLQNLYFALTNEELKINL